MSCTKMLVTLLDITVALLFFGLSLKIIAYSMDLFSYGGKLLRNKNKIFRFLAGIGLLVIELLIILGYLRYIESNFWNEIIPVIYYG